MADVLQISRPFPLKANCLLYGSRTWNDVSQLHRQELTDENYDNLSRFGAAADDLLKALSIAGVFDKPNLPYSDSAMKAWSGWMRCTHRERTSSKKQIKLYVYWCGRQPLSTQKLLQTNVETDSIEVKWHTHQLLIGYFIVSVTQYMYESCTVLLTMSQYDFGHFKHLSPWINTKYKKAF